MVNVIAECIVTSLDLHNQASMIFFFNQYLLLDEHRKHWV